MADGSDNELSLLESQVDPSTHGEKYKSVSMQKTTRNTNLKALPNVIKKILILVTVDIFTQV